MPKMFAIASMTNGLPDVAPLQAGKDYAGHVHIDTLSGYGAYIFSGTAPQLAAIDALPSIVGIVAVTEGGATRWAELDGVISAGVRTKLNTWLTNRGRSTIPAGWTYRQVLNAVYKQFNNKFELDGSVDVTE